MGYEDYLIETKHTLMSITQISHIIEEKISENYWDIIKGKAVNRNKIDEIFALNETIRMILYCARTSRNEHYKEIEPNYNDEFSYYDVMDG